MIAALLALGLAAAPAGASDPDRAARAVAHVERGELEAARALFDAILDEDPGFELPDDAPRRARGYFRLVKEQRAMSGAPPRPAAEPPRPDPASADPPAADPPPSVKPPSTLAIEDPDSVDLLWWTVAGISASAIVVTAVLVGVAVAADPAEPRGSLGRVELP